MSITMRPFVKNDQEYELLAKLRNAVWPDHPATIEMLKHHDDSHREGLLYERLILELDRQPVGVGAYFEPKFTYKPGKYEISALVIPEARGRGVGSAFYQYALDALAQREPRPVSLTSSTRESQSAGVQFLEKRGFKLVMRYPISMLDLTSFNVDVYRPLLDKVAHEGIQIQSLAQMAQKDPEWKRHFYELCELKIMPDVPSPDPYTAESLAEFEQSYFGYPGFDPHAAYVALDGDAYVGLSALFQAPARPEKYFTGLTGVLNTHRRRGIAKALKVYAIRYAQVHGGLLIETDNEENNPMYELNMQLGFKPEPAWVDYERPWEGAVGNE